MKKTILIVCYMFLIAACNQPYDEPRYNYKTIKPDLIPYSDWKKDKDTALKLAEARVAHNAKAACRAMSQTWSLKEIKGHGELDCEESSEGFRCRRKDIEVECRQINER